MLPRWYVFSFAALIAAGCQKQAPTSAPAPVAAREEFYCWKIVRRTTLPIDSVAVHFQRAFLAIGLTNASWTRSADTVTVQGGPTVIDSLTVDTVYRSYATRAVAYRVGDTTRFRYFVAMDPAPRGIRQPSDAASRARQRLLDLCADIVRNYGMRSTEPREANGEDTLAVWRARP